MKSKITNKTLKDLEFDVVLSHIANYCQTDLGKKAVLEIVPIQKKETLIDELHQTNEYLSSFENDNRIPNHQFDEITKEIHLLGVENSFLEAQAFQKIATLSETTIEILNFFKKFAEYFPSLFKNSQKIDYTKEIHESIHKIINRFGEVSDNASAELKAIRKEINSVRGEIGNSFTKALNHYASNDYLDDIRESVIDNQRVLAVQAMHRKK